MLFGGATALLRPVLATAGACVAVVTIYAGNRPGPLLSSLRGGSVSTVLVFVALIACGLWVLRTASPSSWRWGAVIGIVLATVQLGGMLLRGFDGSVAGLFAPENLAWIAVHWIGISWMVSCGLTALIWLLDTSTLRSTPVAAPDGPRAAGPGARLVASLRSADPVQRRRALLVVMGILVLSRVPYLIVYWPGILFFDTLRSYSYARGTVRWDTYEPVGHSLLIAVMQWLGTSLGWSDAGGVAIGAITVILTSSVAFSFMFFRMAVWGLRAGIWVATFAFVALLPVFGYFSVSLVKDVPFSIAVVVFMVCVGELSFGRPETARKLWPWVTLTIAGIFAFLMRKNGIHVVALTLPLLLIPLRHFRKRIVLVLTGIVAAYAIFVGPLYALLDVGPGPKEEPYSVPLQQLGRIAKRHSADLSAPDREFYLHIFAGMPPEELSRHYVPWLADPMKLQARKAWGDHTTAEFLAGWARIAATYPAAAIGATMANTVGYWDPEGPSYDGMSRWSSNNSNGRRIHLAVPGGEPKTGLAAAIESSGFFPTRTYGRGLHDDGYRAIPVLGLAMSPGWVCWSWLVAALLVIRRRDRKALAVFIPAAALLLSFLAGPVSGGQRYSLTLFMALPLAIAAVALARRKGESRETNITEINNEPDRERIQAALADTSGHRLLGVPAARSSVRGQPSEPVGSSAEGSRGRADSLTDN